MEKVWVRSTADPKLHTKVPGIIIRLYGHDFEVQVDGTLCMKMDPAFVKNEVKAGRIKVMKSPPAGKNEAIHKKITIIDMTEPVITPPKGFTMDIGNYYGAGDLNKLIEKVTELKKKEKIVKFADERFATHNLKLSMKVEDIIDKIRSLVDSAYIQSKEES